MTEGTTPSAEERVGDAFYKAAMTWNEPEYVAPDLVARNRVTEMMFAIHWVNATLIDTDELAQLRAEHEALAAFSDGVQKYAPKPVTGCCDDDGACYPPENCRGFREWQEWVVNCAAVEPILARRREAAE